MQIDDLITQCNLRVLVGGEHMEQEVSGCYIGDLLSWAMGKVHAGDVWLTVMGNVNAIAVAVLTEASCLVLVDNASLDQEAKERAIQQGVVVLSTEQGAYELAIQIAEMLQ